ncbi:MAG: hypothetical protein AAF432_11380, partial [Planctomycetota bacterium]
MNCIQRIIVMLMLVLCSVAAMAQDDVDLSDIDIYIELLEDDDRSVRQAAGDKILEYGEPAIEALEVAMREGRARPLGQTKLVYLELLNARLDREWNEKLATLEERFEDIRLATETWIDGEWRRHHMHRFRVRSHETDDDKVYVLYDRIGTSAESTPLTIVMLC